MNLLRYCIFSWFFGFTDVSSNRVSLILQQDWNQGYADSASPEYRNLKVKIETQVGKQLELSVVCI